MKVIKIIIGFLLLFGAGSEYINASRQLGSFFSPGIIIPVAGMLIFSTWLIGTGFSHRKFSFKSFESIKFFVISLVTFATVAFFTASSYAIPANFKTVNGISIPMNKCIDGSESIIPDENTRKEYCLCLAEKITADSLLKSKYKQELERGRLGDISMELQKEGKFMELGLENCVGNIEMRWTENFVNSMKDNWINQLKGTDFEQTNDIEIYVECIMKEYRKHPLSKIMQDAFPESELSVSIENSCTEKSKK